MSKTLFLTGTTGFVGKNLRFFFDETYKINSFVRNGDLLINEDIVIHLAGKAHDIKNTSNPEEYYEVNTELTKKVFDAFILSHAKVFITLSSVKAVADEVEGELTEAFIPNPMTHYGKSKLLAENYILSRDIPAGKRVYILRPCMIHGAGNKGNLNLLYKFVSKGIPWPLGTFDNKRSFCSIDNLLFILRELIENESIPSGIYNISDDEPISTNELISLIAGSKFRKPRIWKISKSWIVFMVKMADLLRLPMNSERIQKLTESYMVSNKKIKAAIGKPLPLSSKEGLLKTFNSFQ
jgi:nucleoside-diphosphate-sugar epimerase